jgi:hypothetical protein
MSSCAAALCASHPFLVSLPCVASLHIVGYMSDVETKILIAVWSCTCISRWDSYMSSCDMSKNKFQQLCEGNYFPTSVWMTIIAKGFRGITPIFFSVVDEVMRQHRLNHLCLRFEESILISEGNGVLRGFPSHLSGLQIFCNYYGTSEIYCWLRDLLEALPSSLELLTVTVANIPSREECSSLMHLFGTSQFWGWHRPALGCVVVRLFHHRRCTNQHHRRFSRRFLRSAQNCAAKVRESLGDKCETVRLQIDMHQFSPGGFL